MSTLVEKVMRACDDAYDGGYCDQDMARAAIATVLRELMEPSELVICAGALAVMDSRAGPGNCVTLSTLLNADEVRTVLRAMISKAADEHGIESGEGT